MQVSTIIANYNYNWHVCTSIFSALNQSITINQSKKIKNKVVVIDDGSTDNSKDKILSTFKFDTSHIDFENNFTIFSSDSLDFISSTNNGASAARNYAMKHCWNDTDFFHILDSDDTAFFYKLEKMINKITEYEEIGVVYADYFISRNGYMKIEHKLPYSVKELNNQCIVHSGSLIKKKYLEKVLLENGDVYDINLHGPASKNFIGCTEDYDLWLRLSKVCMMTHIPEVHTLVSEHGGNQSLKMNQEIFNRNMNYMVNR